MFLSSCSVLNPSQMLRTGKHFQYSKFPESSVIEEYKIAPNDELSFRLFTNDGEKIIDPISGSNNLSRANNLTYLVEFDGKIKLPIFGRIPISELTIREAEKMLEGKYSSFYNNPFVQLRVTNNRVIIFPGGRGGNSKVLTLSNTNTTLFEALAEAGGISDGKARKIKLIRGDLNNPKVYLIDLSTIQGMKQANLVLQANDIIYVEPCNRVPQEILEIIMPYLTLVSTALLIYGIFK